VSNALVELHTGGDKPAKTLLGFIKDILSLWQLLQNLKPKATQHLFTKLISLGAAWLWGGCLRTTVCAA